MKPEKTHVVATLEEHSPPHEVLACLGDAWGTCGCGERFNLTVTGDQISTRELADLWRSHVADQIVTPPAAEGGSDA